MVAVTQFLAERNLPFRGENGAIGGNSSKNANLLGLIEILGNFGPVTKKALGKHWEIKNTHLQYFSSDVQNELIDTMSGVVLKEILQRIKTGKYSAVILNCTSDLSHQEQISLTIQYVSDRLSNQASVGIFEHFIKFISVESSTGVEMYLILFDTLKSFVLNADALNIIC